MPIPGEGTELPLRQAKFLAALLTHASIHDAAQDAGISLRTATNYLKLPRFAAEYARVRKDIVRHALVHVQCLSAQAVKRLGELLTDDSSTTCVYASKAVLDMALRAVTYDDHEQRLRLLEEEPHAGHARYAS